MNRVLWIGILVLALVFSGCTTEKRDVQETVTYGPNVQTTTPPQSPANQPVTVTTKYTTDADEPVEPATPDWVNKVERAEGMVGIDLSKPRGQAAALAKRGALMDAQRRLMEKVGGLQITSKTRVEDMVTVEDLITAQTSGHIRNVTVVGDYPDWENGVYKVVVEMPLYDIWEYVKIERKYTE